MVYPDRSTVLFARADAIQHWMGSPFRRGLQCSQHMQTPTGLGNIKRAWGVCDTMNTSKKFLTAGLLMLLIGAGTTPANAGGVEPATTQLINSTITHLEAALKSIDAKDLAAAQGHVKAAGQFSKLILGGTIEARKQGGSRAITSARQQLEQGNAAGAADDLRKALEGFKSLGQPDKTGNQGGL